MSQDTGGGGGMPLVPIRWRQEQIDRVKALAGVLGLPESVIWRAAFDQGIGEVERAASAVQGKVGAATGTGEPA